MYQITVLIFEKKKGWSTLADSTKYSLCLLGVKGEDNKTDHAICIVGQWIFDSNLSKAIPLSKESLDICCSSGDGSVTCFVEATRGFMLKIRK